MLPSGSEIPGTGIVVPQGFRGVVRPSDPSAPTALEEGEHTLTSKDSEGCGVFNFQCRMIGGTSPKRVCKPIPVVCCLYCS